MKTISVSRLREVLNYDPETGIFTWKDRRNSSVKIGAVAGYKSERGYIYIRVDYQLFGAHRLAVAYVEGGFPPDQVDHVNGNTSDNSYVNLRHATYPENGQNRTVGIANTSGYLGVSFHKAAQRWSAKIHHANSQKYLGLFDTPEEAHAAYLAAKAQLHTFNPVPRQ